MGKKQSAVTFANYRSWIIVMAISGFHIGLEFEVLLLPKIDQEIGSWPTEEHHDKVHRVVGSLNRELEEMDETSVGVEVDYYSTGPAQRTMWTAVADGTLVNDFNSNALTFGIEFVTPVFDFCVGSSFRDQLHLFWAALNTTCNVSTNFSCSTHIHISLDKDKRAGGWTLAQLKAVARSWLYFEHVFTSLGPARRYFSEYAVSQFNQNSNFRKCSIVSACAKIDAATSVTNLVCLMCDAEIKNVMEYTTGNRARNWSLNFINVAAAPNYLGTLEFRRPPGVCSADECLPWVELLVGFVQGALVHGSFDEDGLLAFQRSMRGLQEFLLPVEGYSQLERVEELVLAPRSFHSGR